MWGDQYKEEKILINNEDGHNKFWTAYFDPATNSVHVRWGRIGTKGQSQVKTFSGLYGAVSFIDGKYREKMRKGYSNKIDGKSVDRAQFDELSLAASIVGTQNKCGNFKWVELLDNGEFEVVNEDRLCNPDCNPAMYIEVHTKKIYGGLQNFSLLFTLDKCYVINPLAQNTPVKKTDELYQLVEKVEEAIGRSLC